MNDRRFLSGLLLAVMASGSALAQEVSGNIGDAGRDATSEANFVVNLDGVSGLAFGLPSNASPLLLPQEDRPNVVTGVELWGGLGIGGHNTTGVGEPLDDYGYARSPGPGAEAGVRLLFGHNRYFRHGLTVRGSYQAGRGFGRRGYGFRFALADVGYTFRTNLPCMSNDKRRFYAGATLGISGGYADAGTGRGAMDEDENVRNVASQALDHVTLGWVLGGHIDVHYGALLVGLSIDLRRQYGLDTAADRHMVAAAVLRFGLAFDRS